MNRIALKRGVGPRSIPTKEWMPFDLFFDENVVVEGTADNSIGNNEL